MARPREFDETAALDAAVQCFWTHGYEATSVRDLAGSMGITGASLYNTFSDKRTLYLRALDHYLSQSVRDRIARLEGSLPPYQAIAAFLSEVVERSLRDKQHRGCLLVNCALEVAAHDHELRGAIAAELGEIEGFFRRCAIAGQRAGTITAACSAEDAAKLLLGVLLGIRVLARTRPQRKILEGVMRPALLLLGNPGRSVGATAR
jgi:TetR/AcrR family transcriptional regulator, transcriptional repressor for nem operon